MGALSLFVHSLVMVALPLAGFLSTRSGMLDSVLLRFMRGPITDGSRLIAAGIIAVVAVNCVIAAFVISAAMEPSPAQPESKKTQ